MELKKSQLTKFAKELSAAQKALFDVMCTSQEIVKSDVVRELKRDNGDLLMELSKRFAKFARYDASIDVDNGDVQTLQTLINEIVCCCEENNWFK